MRRWRESDREPFARLNADAEVMEYFPKTLSRAESDAFVDRIEAGFDRHGFGLWVVEVDVAEFIGFVGLSAADFAAPFMPAVEVAWRLDRPFWGNGYATEAARAALAFGFDTIGLNEIVSFTVPMNVRSRRVMERIGMTHNPADDFDHPRLPDGHHFRRHVLYRLSRSDWVATPSPALPARGRE